MDLLDEAQDAHWYYVSKSRMLLRCLGGVAPRTVLDVGAGSGYFSKILVRETSAQSAICVDPAYARDRFETHAGKPVEFRRSPPDVDADLVLLMDVLEHVDDDAGLMERYVSRAAPGTRFVISVPAYAWLWSGHDVLLGHRRRYTLGQALGLARSAGLSNTRGFYFFAAVFPVAVARRLRPRLAAPRSPSSELQQHHPWTNRLLTHLCVAESAVARWNRFYGLTAFVLGEKAA